MDLAEATAPKSDQLNADDLLVAPKTVTIKAVRIVGGEQPVCIDLEEFPRPWKPAKTMLRVLMDAKVWGPDETKWAGRRVTLFREPNVKFGGVALGGIRVSHVEGIDQPVTVQVTVTKGKKGPYPVEPLASSTPSSQPVSETQLRIAELTAEWHNADESRKAEIQVEVEALREQAS